jgi:hypothetical protein
MTEKYVVHRPGKVFYSLQQFFFLKSALFSATFFLCTVTCIHTRTDQNETNTRGCVSSLIKV